MRPGAFSASVERAVAPANRRHLASCGRPLGVLAVLALGATLFTAGASLLGTGQSQAVFHAAAEGLGDGVLPLAQTGLPTPERSARRDAPLEQTLPAPEQGAFGLRFESWTHGGVLAAPAVLVDADRPPLQVEISGFEHLPRWPGPEPGAPR